MKPILLVRALVLLLAVSGCAPAAPSSRSAEGAAVKQGGNVVVVTGHEPQTFDHHLATGVYDNYVTYLLTEGLLKMNPDGGLSPSLAESWEQPDATTYVFHLRQGVSFQDGTPFNAEAVKYNFDRLFDPRTKSPRAAARLGMLESVEVVDSATVRMTTKFPYGPFLAALAGEPVTAIESPAAMEKWGVADYGTHPIGTGPFAFQEWAQGDRIVFQANDHYWGGRPNIDTLTLKVVLDPETRITLLRTGAAHFNVELPPTQFATIKASPDLEAVAMPFDDGIFVEMTNTMAPFDNPLVRQAVCYAIDREAIVKSILLGLSKPGSGVFASSVWAKNPDVEKYAYNPERAKQLLAQAGLGQGFRTTFWHSTGRYSGDTVVAQAIQGYLRQVGIEAELRTGDLSAWASAMRGTAPDKPTAPMYLRGWGVRADPDDHIFVLYHSKNWGIAGNYARYSNAEVDRLLEEAQRGGGRETRKPLYQQAEEIITREAPVCALFDNVRLLAYSKKLRDAQIGPREYQFFDKAWLNQ